MPKRSRAVAASMIAAAAAATLRASCCSAAAARVVTPVGGAAAGRRRSPFGAAFVGVGGLAAPPSSSAPISTPLPSRRRQAGGLERTSIYHRSPTTSIFGLLPSDIVLLARGATSPAAMRMSTDTYDRGEPPETISDVLREAYREGDTDAVLAVAPDLLASATSARGLILAASGAASGQSGTAASIMNALLGGCVTLSATDGELGAERAGELLTAWDELLEEEEETVAAIPTPDLVSFCCSYAALAAGGEAFGPAADDALDRARRLAKKQGGKNIRKAANKARRRGKSEDGDAGGSMEATGAADKLAERYGEDLRILHEDGNVVVVSKPSGMVCFHKHKTSAGKIGKKKKRKKKQSGGEGADEDDATPDVSLEDALASLHVPLSNLNPDGRGVVHRIDRGTSGCVALAKTDEAHALLVAEFFTRGARKSYDALVPAHPEFSGSAAAFEEELEVTGEITLPVGSKAAKSIYEVKRKVGDSAILLRMETKTGRKHQVRVHCAEGLGRPLFLDPVYGTQALGAKGRGKGKTTGGRGKKKGRRKKSAGEADPRDDLPGPIAAAAAGGGDQQRFFLHASALCIPKLCVDVAAPLPSWWEEALTALGEDDGSS